MSVTTMVDTYDTQMMDFNEDADMGMLNAENWMMQPPSRMEEDGQMQDGLSYAYSESLEIDMDGYDGTAEYEMIDEAADVHLEDRGPDIVDAEVFDVSPIPSHRQIDNIHHGFSESDVGLASTVFASPPLQLTIGTGGVPAAPDGLVIHHSTDSAVTPIPTGLFVPHLAINTPEHLQTPLEHGTPVFEAPVEVHPSESVNVPVPEAEVHNQVAEHAVASTEQSGEILTTGETQEVEGFLTVTSEFENAEEQTHLNENAVDVPPTEEPEGLPVPESDAHHETLDEGTGNDEHHEQPVYIEPPSILLSLHLTSLEGEQPEFALFVAPAEGSDAPHDECLVLLQHLPALYYEPISSVFEAFRHEEYFSHLEDLMEAEIALNAYDLQLVISEDNIYAREVSLHDLNAMHEGLGLAGPLRVSLESVVPRFITRYNVLREQITRLSLTESNEIPEDIRTAEVPSHDETSNEADTAQNQTEEEEHHEERVGVELENETGPTATNDGEIATHHEDAPENVENVTEDAVVEAHHDQNTDEDNTNDIQGASHEDEYTVGDEKAEEVTEEYTDETQLDEPQHVDVEERGEDPQEVGGVPEVDEAEETWDVGDEEATEYQDTAQAAEQEEDEEGYGEEFTNDGADGTGVTNEQEDFYDDEADAEGSEDVSEAEDGQIFNDETDTIEEAQLAAVSADHEPNPAESNEEPGIDASRAEQTDASKTTETQLDDDDFPDDDFSDGTLDGDDENEFGEQLPATEILPEIINGDTLGDGIPLLKAKQDPPSERSGVLQRPEKSESTDTSSPMTRSKRRVDDAELDEEESIIRPESPGSKRSRVL